MLLKTIKSLLTPGEKKRPHKCCRDERNMGPVVQMQHDTSFRRCVVCNCRHIEHVVDPGAFGLRGGGV